MYVALEILKLIQAYLINFDNEIYDKKLKKRTKVRTSDLIEEVGQVEFIFSDKTGTLTSNEMEFRLCSIGGKIYGNTDDINEKNTLIKNYVIFFFSFFK